MSSAVIPKIRLWYPFSVAYSAATYSIELKAPEIGNTETKSRNQTMQRTRFGQTLVYDRGLNYNEEKTLQFRSIKDDDKAALQVFLAAVQWGSAKLKFQNYDEAQYTIRINSNKLRYVDTGYDNHNNIASRKILWDFDLDILDLSNNYDELEGTDPALSSALALHIADLNHPHDPATSISLSAADGTKLVESFVADTWDSVSWVFTVVNGASKYHGFIHATNNNTAAGADATTTSVVLEPINDSAGIGSKITFTVTLSGSGSAQIMKLNAASTTNGNTVKVRRIKL